MERKNKRRLVILFSSLGLSIGAFGAILASSSKSISSDIDADETYYLSLTSSNAYSSGSTKTISTASGQGSVEFAYTSASAQSGAHVKLSSGGTIVNNDKITSITRFTVDFSGSLQARLSYDKSTWGSYFELQDDHAYEFTSKPYYVEIKATAQTTITSVSYQYSCVANPDVPTGGGSTSDYELVSTSLSSYVGNYLIVWENGSNSKIFNGTTYNNNGVAATVSNNKIAYSSSLKNYELQFESYSNGYSIKNSNNKYLSGTSGSNALNFGDNQSLNSVSISGGYVDIVSNTSHFRWNNNAQNGQVFKYYKSSSYSGQQPVQLYKQSGSVMPTPVDEVGFEVTDNVSNYYTGSSFDSQKNLTVKAVKSDGSKDAVTNYTYVLKDSLNNPVSTSANLTATGTYTLTISYGTFAPQNLNITVSEKTTPVGQVSDTLNNSNTIDKTTTSYSSWTADGTSGAVYSGQSAGNNGTIQLRTSNNNSGIVTTTSGGDIYSVEVDWNSSTSDRTLNVYGKNTAYSSPSDLYSSNSSTQGTLLGTISSNNDPGTLLISGTYSYIGVRSSSGALYIDSITFNWGEPAPIDPTGISFASASIDVTIGGSEQLTPTISPSNANQNTGVSWSKVSGSSYITVSSSGLVSIDSNATEGVDSAVIRATLYEVKPNLTADITVNTVAQSLDKWTIMIYMSGTNLESDNGFASKDIVEILGVDGQPDDVNIIIETGGASSWKSSYSSTIGVSIPNDKLGRYHVENNHLVEDAKLNYSYMGLTSTFQNFLEWGLSEYPAEKTGVILWNHGGAMSGVCFDYKEESNHDGLLASEVVSAVDSTFNKLGRTEKLEFIGYDACLMQVQDIAELNSPYFNYMLASEESEAGEGWDYDTWVDNLYAGDETPDILKAACDGFISAYDEAYPSYDNDQTLSYLDLSYMSEYKNKFEEFATALRGLSGFNISTFRNTVVKDKVKNFSDTWCDSSDYSEYVEYYNYPESWFTYTQGYYLLHGYYLDGTFDVYDLLTKTYNYYNNSSLRSKITELKTILDNLIGYSAKGDEAGESHGLCCVLAMGDSSEDGYFVHESYLSSETHFTNWRSLALS